jgi:uncharacterized membrane protein
MKKGKELSFLDPPENRKKVIMYLYIALLILFIIDFFIHKHGHFSWETAPEFFAVYGFIAAFILIFIAKVLRLIVKRKEGYYD